MSFEHTVCYEVETSENRMAGFLSCHSEWPCGQALLDYEDGWKKETLQYAFLSNFFLMFTYHSRVERKP